MGTTIYKGVRFSECYFERCDFQHAHFIDCSFSNCTFQNCSGFGIKFDRTEIPPREFLSSYAWPQANFSEASTDTRHVWKKRWLEIRLEIARQLFRSANECHRTEYSDDSLRLLKESELALRKHEASEKGELLSYLANIRTALNLFLTKGGTSLSRLLGGAGITIFVLLPLVFQFLLPGIEFMDQAVSASVDDYTLSHYGYALVAAAVTFLAFGFTSWSFTGLGSTLVIGIVSVIGLIWYALAIPVLVRRVYR